MFKALGKFKTAKDKQRKEKSDKQDDAQTIQKYTKSKDKERDKSRSRKNKKGTGANSTGDVSQSSDDPHSGGNSPAILEDHSDAHRVKGKKRISKTCEETVNKAVAEFFDCAFYACAERFFITTAPVTVCYDLRNTWLRIVEAEWQDPDMREKPSTKPNRVFKRDEPPLPLAYDSWSRGALEPLPFNRLESVADPFLRNSYVLEVDDFVSSIQSSPITDEVERAGISPDGEDKECVVNSMYMTEETEKIPTENAILTSTEVTEEKDRWNFDLDQKPSYTYEPDLELNLISDDSLSQEEYPTPNARVIVETPFHTLLSARPLTLEQSTTDIEVSSPNSENAGTRKARKSKRRFSPSQCGGRVGSGVFHLPLETTPEALLRLKRTQDNEKTEVSKIDEENAEHSKDTVQSATKEDNQISEEDEKLVVQPLFEERSPQVIVAEDNNPLKRDFWKRPSYREQHFKGSDQSLVPVASEINRFLKRRLVNLTDHFKRQAIRSLAARAKQIEEAMLAQAQQLSSAASFQSKSSLESSSKRTNQTLMGTETMRRNTNRKTFPSLSTTNISKVDRMMLMKKNQLLLPSQSVSTMNIVNKDDSVYLTNHSAAKGVTSELQLGDPIKHQQRNKNLKGMANVRTSHKNEHRSLAGKFKDTKRTPAQLQARFENKRRVPFAQNQGLSEGACQSLQSTPSDCRSVCVCLP